MNILNYATRDVLTVSPHDSIDTAMTMMEERGVHHLVVVSDDRAVGMLSDRDVLLSCGWMLGVERQKALRDSYQTLGPTHVEQIMSCPIVSLSIADSAHTAAATMIQRKISALPILQHEQLRGIVTDSDLLSWLRDLGAGGNGADRFLSRPAVDLMRARVYTVEPGAPLSHVIGLFRRHQIRHALVVGETGLLGMISDRDVRRAIGWTNVREAQGNIEDVPRVARDIMHGTMRTTTMGAPIRESLKVMLDERIHALPVLNQGALAGIITATDFVKAIARADLL